MTSEDFWNQWARRSLISAVVIAFGSTALLYIPGFEAWSEALQWTRLLGMGLIVPAVVFSVFHRHAFIRARMAEGMSKANARAEYYKRFPSGD